MKELDVAIKAVKKAGEIMMGYYKKSYSTYTKDDLSPVTGADRECERTVVSIIKRHFPDHNFLGEEFKYEKTNSPFCWIIDPIDGTKVFIRKMPYFGCSIGLEKEGELIVGAIYVPMMEMLAYASKGHGAYINGKKVRVSDKRKIGDSYLIFGDIHKLYDKGYGDKFLSLARKCNGYRGYADLMGLMFVAQGSVDIMLIESHGPWDVAAAKIIIEEAGGKMTDFKGKNSIYSGESIATNGLLHNEVLKIFKK